MALPDLTDVAGRLLQSLGGRRFGVATIHRRENRGERLAGIATGLGRVSRDFDLPILLPLHPAPELRPLQTLLEGEPLIPLLPPLNPHSHVQPVPSSAEPR